MVTSTPALLPTIDEVDVVDISALYLGPGEFVSKSVGAPSVRVVGVDAQQIAEMWRTLPPGEQARCHMPALGLRFFSAGGRAVQEASICFQCNNIFGRAGDADLFYEFDRESEVALKLRSFLQQKVGHPVEEES
jgi:hypothetical protein